MNKARMVKLCFLVGGCVLVTAQACGNRTGRNRSQRPPPPRHAPLDFSRPTVQGGVFRLSSLRGRVVIVSFFSTGCVPCQALFTRIQKVQAALGKTRVAVVAVAVDRQRLFVEPYVETLSLPFPVLYGNLKILRATGLTHSPSVPTLFILDRRGRPRYVHQHMITTRRLAAEVQSLF
jgi:peroxiredoxin